MLISDVKIVQVFGDDKLKAFVTVKFNGCFIVRDMKVIKGARGFFVAMPSKRMRDGSYRDLVHPLDNDTRLLIENTVLEAYAKACNGEKANEDGDDRIAQAL